MQKNEVLLQGSLAVWRQVVRDKSEEPVTSRTVGLDGRLDRRVSEFAEYCVTSGGDQYASVGVAMNEISSQSQELLTKVSEASTEREVEQAGLLLENAVGLYKSLETYYVHTFDLSTGTSGD